MSQTHEKPKKKRAHQEDPFDLLQWIQAKAPPTIPIETFDESLAEDLEEAELGVGLLDSSEESDPHFQSELNYDGYRSVEEYDNDVYYADLDRDTDTAADLKIEDRKENLPTGEESLVDPQGNKR